MNYIVVAMFIHKTTKKVGNKIHHSYLLSESYRENGKVKHRVISNLSRCPQSLIDAIALTIKGQATVLGDFPWKAGKNFGGLFVLQTLAKELSIDKILGSSKMAKLSMFMVLGRILTQGSRRHLTFWREGQAIEEVLGLGSFDEDDLYETLDWLEKNQATMEEEWFHLRFENQKVELFLYDVTSSYLEGQNNELATYGYNRDGKKGKKQIVIGLLTARDGSPIAVEVFRGNTSDVLTVSFQIKKMAERFGVTNVTFVGDRGMVKKIPIELLKEQSWHYITAITKPQIEALMAQHVLQLDLFEEKLVEIDHKEIRYLLRRNPQRTLEIQQNRKERMQKVMDLCEKLNSTLQQKPKASLESSLKKLQKKITQLKLDSVLKTESKERYLVLTTDEENLKKISALDGCYVLTTDLSKENIDAKEVHQIYKDLSHVEWAFRTMKTGLLEIRPLFHRKANRTQACAFIAMLAYAITHHLWKKISHLEKPLISILSALDQIQTKEVMLADQWIPMLPTYLRDDQEILLKTLQIQLPKTIRRIL